MVESKFPKGQKVVITSGRFENFKGIVTDHFAATNKETGKIEAGVVMKDENGETKEAFDFRIKALEISTDTKQNILDIHPNRIAENPKLYKPYVIAELEDKKEKLLQHGNGVWLGQLCYWAGLPNYGSAKQKYERLMKWNDKQK